MNSSAITAQLTAWIAGARADEAELPASAGENKLLVLSMEGGCAAFARMAIRRKHDCRRRPGAVRLSLSRDGVIVSDRGMTPDREPESAIEEIVRRALATSGPVNVGVVDAPPASINDVTISLATLEAGGAIFRGYFTTPAPGFHMHSADNPERWCDRYVLERIHRETLGRLRAEVEPCSDQEFAAFRLRWFHLGDSDLPGGVDGVHTVMD